MMKVVGIFARGDAKKQEQQAMQPTSTTHYVKGGKLRTDNADGTSQVIDLDGKRVISIDRTNKTYGVATFDQIHDAMVQAMQNAQQQQQAALAQHPELQNAQLNITPTIKVTPTAGNRVILGQPTNETKVEMDITMQATGTGSSAPQPGQPNSATMTTNMNTFVAPGVTGYQEFGQFYRRMAQEVGWMKLPSNIHITDPRVSQSMAELQQNSDELEGLPDAFLRKYGYGAGGPDERVAGRSSEPERGAAFADKLQLIERAQRQFSNIALCGVDEGPGQPLRQEEAAAAAVQSGKHRSGERVGPDNSSAGSQLQPK